MNICFLKRKLKNKQSFIPNLVLKMVVNHLNYIAISFYELFIQLKFVTDRLKLFHNLRSLFIKHENIREFSWFILDKQLEKDIETYIQKAKLINTT